MDNVIKVKTFSAPKEKYYGSERRNVVRKTAVERALSAHVGEIMGKMLSASQQKAS